MSAGTRRLRRALAKRGIFVTQEFAEALRQHPGVIEAANAAKDAEAALAHAKIIDNFSVVSRGAAERLDPKSS